MRKLTIFLAFLTALGVWELRAQRPEVSGGEPGRLADDWMARFNALDQWSLSREGKEVGFDQVVDHMMELYASDVIANVPPHDPDQIGPVMLRGSAQVRKWVEKIARTQVRTDYIIPRQTEKQFQGIELVYSTPLPWGGLGVSFPIIAAYSLRADRRRFVGQGTVILQVGEDKKIHRFRLYLTEIDEVRAI
jgi:hypothetical protein